MSIGIPSKEDLKNIVMADTNENKSNNFTNVLKKG